MTSAEVIESTRGVVVTLGRSIAERLVTGVPVRELHFTRDRGAVDVVMDGDS